MIFKAAETDLPILTALAGKLWPDHALAELEGELRALLADEDAAVFLADSVGFAQCQLRRDYVEGTDTSPVGYLEGIYVEEAFRGQGVAKSLLAACETWAASRGCREFASDCELDNTASQRFHLRMGFREANRIVCFVKPLPEAPLCLRPYHPEDGPVLAALFRDTVRSVCARDYTPAQREAWAAGAGDPDRWNASFLAHRTVVAELGGIVVGFGDADGGYLDRLYVHRDYQGRGIASAICGELERGCTAAVLTTHASITARPFFEARGYRVVREQQVERFGVKLTNYVMEKRMK